MPRNLKLSILLSVLVYLPLTATPAAGLPPPPVGPEVSTGYIHVWYDCPPNVGPSLLTTDVPATVKNNSGDSLTEVHAILTLTGWLELAGGSQPDIDIGTLAPDESATVSWNIQSVGDSGSGGHMVTVTAMKNGVPVKSEVNGLNLVTTPMCPPLPQPPDPPAPPLLTTPAAKCEKDDLKAFKSVYKKQAAKRSKVQRVRRKLKRASKRRQKVRVKRYRRTLRRAKRSYKKAFRAYKQEGKGIKKECTGEAKSYIKSQRSKAKKKR